MLLRNAKNGIVIANSFVGNEFDGFDQESDTLFGKEYLDKTKYKELTKELKRRKL